MATATDVPAGDGREDFDFLFGTWRVAARRLTDPLDPACTTWHDFALTAEARPVLNGLGNQDSYRGPDGPDGRPFDGMTLRLFDPHRDLAHLVGLDDQPGPPGPSDGGAVHRRARRLPRPGPPRRA